MPYPVSEREREELRAALPFLLERELGVMDLQRSFRCPNPDHDDSNPSAKYYPDSQTVHCFGCGKTWDVFSLVGTLHSLASFPEQAKWLAGKIGYNLYGVNDAAQHVPSNRIMNHNRPLSPQPRKANMHIDFDSCLKMYESMFTPEGNIARDYLHFRGIGDDDIARYGLGFSKDPKGLVPEFSIYEPTAKGFVMIPFYDAECTSANYCVARPVGTESITCKEWRPKGVATVLWQEWNLCSHAPILYVAEGVLDAMSLEKQLGKPCVALCSTSNVPRFCSILCNTPATQRPAKVMIAMDEDEAGHAATEKLSAGLKSIGIAHAVIPPYPNAMKDANEWRMAGCGTEWAYDVEPLGNGLTPVHISRRIDNGL